MEAQRAKMEEAMAAARQTAADRTSQAAQAIHTKLEPLGELSEELAQKLEALKEEAQQRADALSGKQDFFERRLMRSYPTLHAPRYGDALKKLREYWEKRKK